MLSLPRRSFRRQEQTQQTALVKNDRPFGAFDFLKDVKLLQISS